MRPGPVAVECANGVLHGDYPAVARAVGDWLETPPADVPEDVVALIAAQASLTAGLVSRLATLTAQDPSVVMAGVGLAVATEPVMEETHQ